MRKLFKQLFFTTLIFDLGLTGFSFAGDLEWSGMYRAEGISLNGPALDSNAPKQSKQYGVHTLILRPKIVAADGLYINAQFDIFNAHTADNPEVGSQLGEYFGGGLDAGSTASTSDSNVLGNNAGSSQFRASQYYLTYVQEYGSLIVGRAPVQFGLGMSYSAGRGLFDHYSTTRDLVGYKIAMGNFYVFPMYAKISEFGKNNNGSISGYDDVNEINVQVQYENPESDATMGVFYQSRKASSAGNDVPTGGLPAPAPDPNLNGDYNAKNFNVFYKKETTDYTAGLEVAQQSGDMGANTGVGLSGFGVAFEYEYHKKESKNAFGIKAGYATGDDLSTKDEYEGFIFNRNYDVAMFLFNQSLGQADFFHTKMLGAKSSGATTDQDYLTSDFDRPDIEAISNVTYLSPYYRRKFSDRWTLVGTLTTGFMDDSSIDTSGGVKSTKSNLGYELDLSLVFNVTEKIIWSNQFGYFAPGDAFEGGSEDFGTKSLYGFITKAAVSF